MRMSIVDVEVATRKKNVGRIRSELAGDRQTGARTFAIPKLHRVPCSQKALQR